MLSATKLAHLKLTYLHAASNALFLTSPPVSAHLSSTLSINASRSNIQLSESTWRKTCAACGSAQVPGLTCSVRIRGIGGDPGIGWTKNPKPKPRTARSIGDVEVLGDAGRSVENDRSRRVRKRGKRTRGARGGRGKPEPMELPAKQVLGNVNESATTVPVQVATTTMTSTPIKSRKKPKAKSSANKESRMVYSCKICSSKTIHSLPKKPAAEVPVHRPATVTAISLSKPLADPASKSTPATTGSSHQSVTAPVSTTASSSTNAAAKKRAKSRKNTLSSMLAKEAANRSSVAGNGAGGFGFDLMDFLKTS
ncbi:hypothetical protein TWF718_003678 [Orbilia javanica]|uniref:Uncharacterized protein n=1 Tax=Orbilia javanica TaxID=47235 RepID=A0AAN8RPU4_9PEZI